MDADLETVSLDVLNIVFCFRDGNGLECLEVYPWRGKVYSIRFDFGGSVSEGSSNNTEDSSLCRIFVSAKLIASTRSNSLLL